MEETTIAAISTAMSASGIGIVRISGPEAFEIASGVYRSKGGKKSLKNVVDRSNTDQRVGLHDHFALPAG